MPSGSLLCYRVATQTRKRGAERRVELLDHLILNNRQQVPVGVEGVCILECPARACIAFIEAFWATSWKMCPCRREWR